MKKIIEYITKKEIEYKELIGSNGVSLCAYKNTVYVNGIEDNSYEGICYLKDLLSLKDNNSLPSIKLQMFKKDIENVFNNNNPNNVYFYDKVDVLKIKNPYTYSENNDDWGLYLINFSSNSIYDHNNEELPKGIYFDYINGHISNDLFDLDYFLEKLKLRDDIEFKDGEDEIMQIPYYNRTYETNTFLKFLWTPGKEDYNMIKKLNYSNKYEYIIKNIFGIKDKDDLYCY